MRRSHCDGAGMDGLGMTTAMAAAIGMTMARQETDHRPATDQEDNGFGENEAGWE